MSATNTLETSTSSMKITFSLCLKRFRYLDTGLLPVSKDTPVAKVEADAPAKPAVPEASVRTDSPGTWYLASATPVTGN
jgi:hypothetical protein